MPGLRTSIAGIMFSVLVAALALTALRSNFTMWSEVLLLCTCAALALAVVGAACRAGVERAGWLGFGVFGWGYLAFTVWCDRLPTLALLWRVRLVLGIPFASKFTWTDTYERVGHCVIALAAATFGGFLANVLVGSRVARERFALAAAAVGSQLALRVAGAGRHPRERPADPPPGR